MDERQTSLPCAMLEKAKWAFTTRNVPREIGYGLQHSLSPNVGDLLLARVQQIRSHRRVQTRDGRYSGLFVDDLIVATCGARHATDQFEGIAEVKADGRADLLAGGGVIGRVLSRNERMKPATTLEVLGRLTGHSGQPINVADHAITPGCGERPSLVIGVVGSAMNSGKTDVVAWFIHGLEKAGLRTAGLKLTGTGSFGDLQAYADAGASAVLDFTDAGMVSTYLEPIERIMKGCDALLSQAARQGCDVAIVELADGVTQAETALILDHPNRSGIFDGFILAASDTLAAHGGVALLASRGIKPIALSGLLTRSPLAVQELQSNFDISVISREGLADPAMATAVAACARPARRVAAA